MTPEERAASQKRCDEATPGAKVIFQTNTADARGEYYIRFRNGYESGVIRQQDAKFFVHALTDLPVALKDLEAAEKRIVALDGEIKELEFAERHLASCRKRCEAMKSMEGMSLDELGERQVVAQRRIAELERNLSAERDVYDIERSQSDMFERERDEAREKLAAASVHQQETDIRVTNQREEIKRQADEITAQGKRLLNFDRWKGECKQWKDKDSAFWKISELEKKLAASELAMAQVRAAVEDLPHTKNCHSEYGHAVPCNCITSCIKSRIPTGPDSALVEAVKKIVRTFHAGGLNVFDIKALVALSPESWKDSVAPDEYDDDDEDDSEDWMLPNELTKD